MLGIGHVFRAEGEEILDATLTCGNGACGASYPVVGGVPIVVRDMPGWWRSQSAAVSAVLSKADALRGYFDALRDEPPEPARALLGTYMDFHYGDARDAPAALGPAADPRAFWAALLAAAVPGAERKYERVLDLGCSVGRYTFELARVSRLAVGIDTDFSRVYLAEQMRRCQTVSYERKARGRLFEKAAASYATPRNAGFLVADALDPPFRAGCFDLVAALNLVDSVALPLVLLAQMDALLACGGVMILCAPYEWRLEICDRSEWLETEEVPGPVMLRSILEGTMLERAGFSYRVCGECPDVPWVLRNSDRHWSLYLAHLVKAVKDSPGARA